LTRSNKRHTARFATSRKSRPRIRGTLSVKGRTLRARVRVDRASLDRPRNCRPGKTVHLAVQLIVHDRRGRTARVSGDAPYRCGKAGRLSSSAPGSPTRVTSTRVRSGTGGTASVLVACRGQRRCRGTVTLSARLGSRRARVVGRGRFALRPKAKGRVGVRLSVHARKALAAGGRLRVTATVRTGNPAGGSFVGRKRLVLVAP
jgi:hypothetical protein